MARTQNLVDFLKQELRSRGISYKDVSGRLNLSESAIKHMFSTKNFSLKRMDEVCEILGLEISDLVAAYERQSPKIEQLSLDNERELVSDPKLVLVAYCVVNHWTYEQILSTYDINEFDCIQNLAKLDRMKMIDLLPENKIKPLISNNFTWHKNGPIEQFFRKEAQESFLNASFAEEDACRIVKLGDLSDKSLLQIIDRLESIGELYDDLNREDSRQAFSKRHGASMMLAIRKWEFGAFRDYLK